jgi:hypothetical protein
MCTWKSGKSGYSENRVLTAGTRVVSYGGYSAGVEQKAAAVVEELREFGFMVKHAMSSRAPPKCFHHD